ncbi:MAG: hypothetical protein OXC40_01480 [Proteobacteria bacterium]|nr:hypothetical protein [Pseudomonadota bacterium]
MYFLFNSSAAYSASLDNLLEEYDIESLNVSLSDIEGIEDVLYEAYAEEFKVVSKEEVGELYEVLLSGSNGSLDLDVLSKVGAFRVAFNPLKKSLYAEVDFMALALANKHKDKVKKGEGNAAIVFAVAVVVVAVIALSRGKATKSSKVVPSAATSSEDLVTEDMTKEEFNQLVDGINKNLDSTSEELVGELEVHFKDYFVTPNDECDLDRCDSLQEE